MLKRLCAGEITEDDIEWINTRVLGRNGLKLPKRLEGNACYASYKNMERNSITAGIFDQHLKDTHPPGDNKELPLTHTLIIEAHVDSKTNCSEKKPRSLRRRIMKLGDDDVKHKRTLVDPRLCCYKGAFLMCNSNKGLKEKGTGNGTQCRLLKVKIRDHAESYMCKIWNNMKVWTVRASGVECVEFEHYPKTQTISNLECLSKHKKQEQLDNPTDTGIADIENIESKLTREVNLQKFKLSPKFFGKCKVLTRFSK